MKKILFSLLAIFFIAGITKLNACETCGCKNKNAENQEVVEGNEDTPKCAKTGKVCPSTCAKKATKKCCEGKKTAQNNSGFNFNKSNSYGNTSSTCSKSAQKTCSKSAQKTCSKSAQKTEEDNKEE